jgi:hypothetical protein
MARRWLSWLHGGRHRFGQLLRSFALHFLCGLDHFGLAGSGDLASADAAAGSAPFVLMQHEFDVHVPLAS